MSLVPEDKNLVNRYLNDELSGIELEHFRTRMSGDDSFAREVNFQSLLRTGILFSREEELKKRVLGKIRFRKTRIPFALKLIFTFLVVTVLGITLWFYVGTDSANKIHVNSFFSFISKDKEKKATRKTSEAKKETSGSEVPENTSSDVAAEGETRNDLMATDGLDVSRENDVHEVDTSQIQNSEEIVIKKDQLLITSTIAVIEKPVSDAHAAELSSGQSLAKEAAQKLNPAAGIPDEPKVSPEMVVEFWVSPVNYHGYKMSKNKLILFGIEEPDAVKLYRTNDMLFMKYGNDYFRLINSFDFLSYQRLKETEIPLAIRQ
ncbi:MAG: hypothetical protein NT126_09060 [Bacteroidetes bacterium]|nr:hypothetical protein [Bacteroidota bacterium]